jgi:hypothetical protein
MGWNHSLCADIPINVTSVRNQADHQKGGKVPDAAGKLRRGRLRPAEANMARAEMEGIA